MNHAPRAGSQAAARSSTLSRRALVLVAALACFAAAAQTPAESPLARSAEPAAYPDGGRLRSTYKPAPVTSISATPLAGPDQAVFGRAVRDAFQGQLPPGFRLREPTTTRVMAPAAGAAPERRAAGTPSSTKYFALHPVEFRGVPLSKGSDYLVVTDESGAVLSVRERGVPSAVDATAPTVRPPAAVAAARRAGGNGFSAAEAGASVPRLEVWVGPDQRGTLAWVVTLASTSLTAPMSRTYWVAATGAPRILNSESNIYHTHFGAVTGTVWQGSPLGPTASVGLTEMTTSRVGATGGTSLTGVEGRYAYVAGAGNATVSGSLSGPAFVVQNMAGALMTRSQAGMPASALDLNFGGTSDVEFAQPTAFHWANAARRVAAILSPAELAALPTRVNIAGACNAFWNGSSINFFRAGGGCPNMAYADVVMHEYGHGVDAVKGGIIDGGYSEGFGDALAVLGTRQPCLGRDFFGPGTCLRPASDVIMWPPGPGEGVHAQGRRYAGFVWELIQQLRKTYADDEAFSLATRLVTAAAAANPASIPDAVRLSFIADDTDSNLATCSPHARELAAAADSRAIPRPADCVGGVGGVPAAAAQFPWTPAITLAANANLASTSIVLDRPMELHITANSSLRPKGAAGQHTTGFYLASSENIMWTNSLRNLTTTSTSQWVNFGSTFAIRLPAGNYTIFWKIWTTTQVEFSAGSMLLEAFPVGTTAVAPLREPAAAASPDAARETGVDEMGASITRAR